MSAGRVENLPAVRIPHNAGIPLHVQNERGGTGTISACFTPDSIDIPPNTHSSRFPGVDKRSKGILRVNGYAHRTITLGSPNVLQRIFTGQLPPSYFNELCYGRRATPREYLYRTPTKEREKELWEPKNVSREKTRHVVRDIQDARFRRQSQLEKQSARKSKIQMRKTEQALLRESDIMSRGLKAYLFKLDKEKQKYDKPKHRRVKRAIEVKPDVKTEDEF